MYSLSDITQGLACSVRLVAGIACIGSVALSASAQPAMQSSLAQTSWQLVQVQSMDDAVGTTRPADPSRYTMTFNADGTVAMQLNCNRGSGTWQAQSTPGGDSGSLEFGPIAVTRALCPPPSLDEQIARDSSFVRSYLLRDGQLHLSLMADGGIYSWEPLNLNAQKAVVPLAGPGSGR